VGAPRKGTRDAAQVHEHLDELARLADTAGAEVVGRAFQLVSAPTPDLYVGKGKAAEIGRQRAELEATLVVFDEELSPRQGKHLEDLLGTRVMDRTELILDIFALRARSREAKLQVELAQLEYLLPRLTRMWVHLSRIRGGIGLRGPGETQLETDRRVIRRKIGVLKQRLAEVAAHRGRLSARSRDRGVVRAALVGYTNAGKSSLLRALTRSDAHVEDRLFATLDTQSREVELLPSGTPVRPHARTAVRFTDTVGFIRKLPHDLVASFRATLEEAADADVILHVVDASHPAWRDQMDVVEEVLERLLEERLLARTPRPRDLLPGEEPPAVGVVRVPAIAVVLNKADLLTPEERAERVREVGELGLPTYVASAQTGLGVSELLAGAVERAGGARGGGRVAGG
jgi:GTP-binding protein HflX